MRRWPRPLHAAAFSYRLRKLIEDPDKCWMVARARKIHSPAKVGGQCGIAKTIQGRAYGGLDLVKLPLDLRMILDLIHPPLLHTFVRVKRSRECFLRLLDVEIDERLCLGLGQIHAFGEGREFGGDGRVEFLAFGDLEVVVLLRGTLRGRGLFLIQKGRLGLRRRWGRRICGRRGRWRGRRRRTRGRRRRRSHLLIVLVGHLQLPLRCCALSS